MKHFIEILKEDTSTSLYQQLFTVDNNRFTDIQFIRWKIGNYCIAVKRLLWTITSC